MSLLGVTALGVDVSDGALKAVRISRRGRRLVLERTWRLPFGEGPDADLDALARLMAAERPGPHERIVVSAPEHSLISRTYTLPPMADERLEEMARYELLADAGPPADDWILRLAVRRGPSERVVHGFALRRAAVDAFRGRLAGRGLPCDALEAPGCALASLVEHQLPMAGDRVLLGVGTRASELVLHTARGLWIRPLPIGLEDGDAATLAARLAAEVEAAAAFFLPAGESFRPADAVLTEEGANDAAFTTALRRALGLPVTRLTSLQRVRDAWRLRHAGQSPEQALAMAKAMGLALAGLGLARLRCTIEVEDPGRAAKRSLPLVAGSVLAASALLVGTGELGRRTADRYERALPVGLQGALLERAGARDRLLGEHKDLERRAEAWLALSQRRLASLDVRAVLAALQRLSAERGEAVLHLEQLWAAAPLPGRRGALAITLLASAELDETLHDRLFAVFVAEFGSAEVRGPEPDAAPDRSRWTVELDIP